MRISINYGGMIMRKYGLKAMALIAAFSLSCPVTTLAAWEQQADGSWKYYDRNGNLGVNKWAKSGDYWYHLNGNGDIDYNMLIEDQGQTYYVDTEGRMAANQWVNYNGVYYYAGEDGAFLRSTVTPDGYTVDVNGVWDQNVPQQNQTQSETPRWNSIEEMEADIYLTDAEKQLAWSVVKQAAKNRLKYPNTAIFPEWNDEGINYMRLSQSNTIYVKGWGQSKNGIGNYVEISIRGYLYADSFKLQEGMLIID